MFVMGTAGHVDHGKSTLVTALSGIDPDRLPEEKARGMTIDLGFAWMTTPSGQTIGIVDVPGHERFVKNMIAGVGAIDFVLLVIAADDGWMPQTEEHLAILRFLRVQRGIAVITKKSLADPDWLDLVRADVTEKIKDAFPAQAETIVVAVDSISGEGVDKLRAAIDAMVASLPQRRDIGRPRLYIDRVFAMTGRGAVVTGTLIDGSLSVGQSIAIAPGERSARIRELQIHKKSVESAAPGQRLAVNLAGVDAGDLSRGQCLVAVDDTDIFDRVWAHVSILPDARLPLDREREVLLMVGTAEPAAYAFPLGDDIPPGGEGLCEFRLQQPIKARLKDRFVLRWPTPQVTIGGGEILDFGGPRRRQRNDAWTSHLQNRINGSLPTYRATELQTHGYRAEADFLKQGPWTRDEVRAEISRAKEPGELVIQSGVLFDPAWLSRTGDSLTATLLELHREQPFVTGLNLAEWGNRAGVPPAAMIAVADWMLASNSVSRTGDAFHLTSHTAALPDTWQKEADKLWTTLTSAGLAPPTRDELEPTSPNAKAILAFWISSGKAVSLGDGIILPADAFSAARSTVVDALSGGKSLSAGQLRELLGTTRKYAVPILERLDRDGVTRRVGDERVLCEEG
jgi:selenocysteine-specific elongation factor